MAVLHVRDIPDTLYKKAKLMADANGRSLSAEIVTMMEAAVTAYESRMKHRRVMAKLRARAAKATPLPAGYVADLVREVRGEIDARLTR
jgi:hypothetical protein